MTAPGVSMASGREQGPQRCGAALGLSLLFTAGGLALLAGGGLGGAAFADLLLYCGVLGLIFGAAWAVLWHVGNLEAPPQLLRDDVGLAPTGNRLLQRRQGLGRLLRTMGRRLSSLPSPRLEVPPSRALEA